MINQDYGTESLYFKALVVGKSDCTNLAEKKPGLASSLLRVDVSRDREPKNIFFLIKHNYIESVKVFDGTKANLKLNYRCIEEYSLDLNTRRFKVSGRNRLVPWTVHH